MAQPASAVAAAKAVTSTQPGCRADVVCRRAGLAAGEGIVSGMCQVWQPGAKDRPRFDEVFVKAVSAVLDQILIGAMADLNQPVTG
jgi:hypothetical protein